MGRVKGGATTSYWESQEQYLHGHIKSAAAGKTYLTADEIVDLLRSAFPDIYAGRDRKFLTQRVAKLVPPTPPVKKSRITPPDEDKSSNSEGSSGNSVGSDDQLGHDEDENGNNPPISGELGGSSGELGHDEDVNGRNPPISGELGQGENASGSNRPLFKDLGGIDSVIDELRWEVVVPLHQLELRRHLGVEPTARILLHGPPECGKTTLARALANEAGLPLFEVYAADLVSGVSGAPEEKIRELFSTACASAPSIVFIDEIDAMTSKTENLQKEIEPAIVNQLMACMDEANKLIKPLNHDVGSESSDSRPRYVLVIGATNRPDVIDPALRRRFDREIVIDGPDEDERENILSLLTRSLKVEDGLDLSRIARFTLGYVGGDLVELVKKAGVCTAKRIVDVRKDERDFSNEDCYKQPFSNEEMKNVSITMADFLEAAKTVQPSSKVEDFTCTPIAKWDDIGGLESLKLEFEHNIIKPIKFPGVFEGLDLDFKTAYFLYGPSGCRKSFLGEALANEAGAKFVYIKACELVKVYGRDSELVLRIIFNYATTCTPCIVYIDEVDGVFRYNLPARVFGQLLSELDGVEGSSGVYIIAATNTPECVSYGDEAFKTLMYVPLPTPEERGAILKALARNKPIDADVDLMALGKDVACKNFSGADLFALMKGASDAALDRPTSSGGGCRLPWTIKDEDFKSALRKIKPPARFLELKAFERFSRPKAGKQESEKMIAVGKSYAKLLKLGINIVNKSNP